MTVMPWRTSAPASAAASVSSGSRTVRRMQTAASIPSIGHRRCPRGRRRRSRTGPCDTNGTPVARTRSSRPHRARRATPAGWMVWPDRTSLGNEARSTTRTRRPRRASSMAVGAPAQRLPMTMASYMSSPRGRGGHEASSTDTAAAGIGGAYAISAPAATYARARRRGPIAASPRRRGAGLLQQPLDVLVDRSRRDEQALGHLTVGRAVGDEDQHVDLAGGDAELGQHRRAPAPASPRPGAGAAPAHRVPQQPPRNGRRARRGPVDSKDASDSRSQATGSPQPSRWAAGATRSRMNGRRNPPPAAGEAARRPRRTGAAAASASPPARPSATASAATRMSRLTGVSNGKPGDLGSRGVATFVDEGVDEGPRARERDGRRRPPPEHLHPAVEGRRRRRADLPRRGGRSG